MNAAVRPGVPGASRPCPHCKALILESACVCPGCRGHLRFDPDAAIRGRRRSSPLHVEGTLSHLPGDAPLEYTLVVAIRNERGEEIARHVVGVGALLPDEQRTFSVMVEVAEAADAKAIKPAGRR